MLHVMHVLVRVLSHPRRIEQPRDVELGRRLSVGREQEMDVVTLGKTGAPRFTELRRPRWTVPRARRLRERVELPVEDRQLMCRVAILARAAEPQTKRKLDD